MNDEGRPVAVDSIDEAENRAAQKRQMERSSQHNDLVIQSQHGLASPICEAESNALEAQIYDVNIGELRSFHKECSVPWNWKALVNSPESLNLEGKYHGLAPDGIRKLAQMILDRDPRAYEKAIDISHVFGVIERLGSTLEFHVVDETCVEVTLHDGSRDAIPTEEKRLLKDGRLSIKPISKSAFNRLHRDILSGCTLRIARELFALLPIGVVIVTATSKFQDRQREQAEDCPVLSIVIPKRKLDQVAVATLEPYEAAEEFVQRIDFRKIKGLCPIPRTARQTQHAFIRPECEEILFLSTHPFPVDSRDCRRELVRNITRIAPSADAWYIRCKLDTPPTFGYSESLVDRYKQELEFKKSCLHEALGLEPDHQRSRLHLDYLTQIENRVRPEHWWIFIYHRDGFPTNLSYDYISARFIIQSILSRPELGGGPRPDKMSREEGKKERLPLEASLLRVG